MQLLTVQTMLMFLLTVFYDLQSPRDNSCGLLKIRSACLARKTAFDQTQNYCKWSSVTRLCTFNQPKFSVLVIVYIAALVSAFTAVLNEDSNEACLRSRHESIGFAVAASSSGEAAARSIRVIQLATCRTISQALCTHWRI